MRKVFKIILAIFAAIIILIVAFGAIVFLDLAAYTATGSQTLTPAGTSVGKAIVIYDPGLSGTVKTVADKIASDLQAQQYTVTLAGIKSSAAANHTGYRIIVVGGPIYAGTPTGSVKDYLNNLKPDQETKVGVFGSGQGATSPDDIASIKNSIPALLNGSLSDATIVKIGQTEDPSTRASEFVTELLK